MREREYNEMTKEKEIKKREVMEVQKKTERRKNKRGNKGEKS